MPAMPRSGGTMTTNERRRFLADQWAGAVDDTQGTLIANAAMVGVSARELGRVGSTPTSRAVWATFIDGVRSGNTTPCKHLDANAPGKVYWTSIRPEHLWCRICWIAFTVTLDTSTLPDTGPCTACGTETAEFHSFALVVGPVSIAAVICSTCYAETRPS
jgi:hypothetical protein